MGDSSKADGRARGSTRVRWANGPFAIVPRWIVRADISDRAVRLFAVLTAYADGDGEGATPSRKQLAETLRCSTSTLDEARAELVRIGAISVRVRRLNDGSQTANEYVLCPTQRDTPPDASVDPPPDVSGGNNETEVPRESANALSVRAPVLTPKTVDRKPVKAAEHELARAVLASFNEQAGTKFASDDWLAKIIRRHREYPALDIAAHTRVIETNLAHPWWKGPPTPSVIYGNAAQFERSLTMVGRRPDPTQKLGAHELMQQARQLEQEGR